MHHRRTGALVGATLLFTLAACGSGSDDAAPTTDGSPAATAAPADEDSSDGAAVEAEPNEPDATDVPPAEAGEPASSDEPEAEAEQPVDTEAAPVTDAAPAEPVVTEAPAPAEPVVGGRLFATDVQPAAEFDGNPFPDLVVDDIGKDAKVNIRNILPSDRPVLLWAWAPH